jgi:hypothetical protein
MAELIKLSLGKEPKRVFESIEDFEKWFRSECAFWNKLQQSGNRFPIPQDVFEFTTRQGFQGIQAALEACKQASPELQPQSIKSLEAQCKQAFERKGILLSTSPEGKFISQLQDNSGPAVATFAAAYFMELDVLFEKPPAFKGGLEAFCFESGLKKRSQSEIAALEDLKSEWATKYQTLKDQYQNELAKQIDTESQNQGLFQKQEKAIQDFFKQIQQRWNALVSLYEEKLSIGAPVLYWKKKAKQHFWSSFGFGVASLLFAIGGFAYLTYLAREVLIIPSGIREPDKWHPAYWQLTTLLIGAAFVIWLLRILVKLFLSNVHLHTDSCERITMVQTYLALLRTKKTTEEERKLVIAALFRPAATGVVKDDGMPIPTLEFLTKTPRP